MSGQFADLVLSVGPGPEDGQKEGEEIREFAVHKLMLAFRSPVFAAMLIEHNMEEKATGKVRIPDIKVPVFELLLRYIYSGQVDHLDRYPVELMQAADKVMKISQLNKLDLWHFEITNSLTISLSLSLTHSHFQYAIEHLKVLCGQYLCSKLAPDNVLEALWLADMHAVDNLKLAAIDFAKR